MGHCKMHQLFVKQESSECIGAYQTTECALGELHKSSFGVNKTTSLQVSNDNGRFQIEVTAHAVCFYAQWCEIHQ